MAPKTLYDGPLLEPKIAALMSKVTALLAEVETLRELLDKEVKARKNQAKRVSEIEKKLEEFFVKLWATGERLTLPAQ